MQRAGKPNPYAGREAVLATMHRKEQAIARPMRAALGLRVVVPEGLNTDAFGSFSGEVPREGTPLEAARRKALGAAEATGLDLALASEGSYGPHPEIPFIAGGEEVILFIDRTRKLEVSEKTLTIETNYRTEQVKSPEAASRFLAAVRFPSHAVIVQPTGPEQFRSVYKALRDRTAVDEAIRACVGLSPVGEAILQPDMRAHLNPTRMRVIRGVAFRLARRISTPCPSCQAPGFGLVDVLRRLPCAWCGGETILVRAEIHGCVRCDFRQKRPRKDGRTTADPGQCPQCNP